MSSFRLPFDDLPESLDARIDARDRAGRERAVDPRYNVALEASAGTGKTRVLVDRYINLLRAGVDPSNILAMTFTRKAAAEMRERIVSTLRTAAARGEIAPARWRELRDRMADIAISTIDAFCLSLLREFPLEADVDPGFTLADETEVPRLVDEALDRALRTCRGLARQSEEIALAFAQLGERRVRAGLAVLLNRRIVAPAAVRAFLASGPRDLDTAAACRRLCCALHGVFEAMPGGLEHFLETGPIDPSFTLLIRDLQRLDSWCAAGAAPDPAAVQAMLARVRGYFLTQEGSPRKRLDYTKDDFTSAAEWRHHRDAVVGHAEAVHRVLGAYRRDLNVIVSRGIWRMFQIAMDEYRRTLESHAVLDFSDVLLRALELLRQMDEFAQSRYRLESRYHHILVDEFQDTSRAQWELVSLLVQSWGQGFGLAHTGPLQPTIFIVGDRKQSIYGFRDADVSVLEEAGRYIGSLRGDRDARHTISRSFRSVPALLAFVNDLCRDLDKASHRVDAFRYDEVDRFPLDGAAPETANVLGLITGDAPEVCADTAAGEIARLLASGEVRDRDTGMPRRVRAGDIGILFRTRESHREFERALEARGIPSYVYKGLGFFDADEIKDSLALFWYLADPLSNLRAAAFLRSRFAGVSDEALRLLAPAIAEALGASRLPAAAAALDEFDRRALELARNGTARWRALVDRLPPAELFDLVLAESAYGIELRGPRLAQARENLKKMRALVRRIQNRGYATLGRIAAHLDRLSAGDESNAVIDALDAVNLMTVHAAKGLEFPVVFVVNLARGTGSRRDPIRVTPGAGDETAASVSVGDFQSEVDEDAAAREREETKRLLYVALTRARDRLYLASVLKEGKLQPGRGSLAEVLPASFLTLFSEAATSAGDAVGWRASSGVVHRFRCVEPAEGSDPAAGRVAGERALAAGRAAAGVSGAPAGPDDFEPLSAPAALPRTYATAIGAADAAAGGERAPNSDRLLGTLVHRLLERFGLDAALDVDRVTRAIPLLVRAEELVDVSDVPALAVRAASAYAALCTHARVRALYTAGERLHEVPFTMRTAAGFVRGTIDCLVRSGDDRVTVLEFKTGGPRPEHRAQLDIYRDAASHIFPGARVEALLVYPDAVAGEPAASGA